MRAHDLDTLVLHESDIVHQIVYPRAHFDPYALWSDMPSRRGENAIFNNRAYMQDLLRLTAGAGITVYLNVKEIGFSDEVLALQPQVFKDGAFCPSELFWRDYIGHKTDELFTDSGPCGPHRQLRLAGKPRLAGTEPLHLRTVPRHPTAGLVRGDDRLHL